MKKNDSAKSNKRKDSKGRILREGESQRPDGRYMYAVVDPVTKERKYIYSWKLERHDPTPKGKRIDKSLREKISELQVKDFVGVSLNGGGLTVAKLVDKYIETKRGVSPSTRSGYKTCQNFLKKDPFGQKRIDTVTVLDAKQWLVKLQDVDKKSYSSIHSLRGVIRPAFQLAVESNYIYKNPFNFELKGVLIDDSIKRQAVSRADERKFLQFIKGDEYYSRYYDAIFILFNTGLRIGELCGLTLRDIDLENRVLNVDHQLQYNPGVGKNIRKTKTDAGTRKLPMSDEVYDAFTRVLRTRKASNIKEEIDGFSNFLFLNRQGKVLVGYQFEKIFERIIEKHNTLYKQELPKITPHMCRHTYCTRMASTGISVQTLKYLMGHADIQTTMNVYTHLDYNDAAMDLKRVAAKAELEQKNIITKEPEKCKIINLAEYA